MSKAPKLKLATWADYADIVDQRMTILRTYSYVESPSLPLKRDFLAAIQVESEDEFVTMKLHLRLQNFEGSLIAEQPIEAECVRTLTGRCVTQFLVFFAQIELTKHENSLDVIADGFGSIGELALPVVTAAMKR